MVVGDKQHIGCAIVEERRIQVNDRPIIGYHGDISAKHLVGSRNVFPIVMPGESGFRRVFHIKVVMTCFYRATIIKSNTGDHARIAKFLGGIDLFGKGVFVQANTRKVFIRRITSDANLDTLNKVGHQFNIGHHTERIGNIIRNHIAIKRPIGEEIACGRRGSHGAARTIMELSTAYDCAMCIIIGNGVDEEGLVNHGAVAVKLIEHT